jgi:hypothetical protein
VGGRYDGAASEWRIPAARHDELEAKINATAGFRASPLSKLALEALAGGGLAGAQYRALEQSTPLRVPASLLARLKG